MANTTSTSLQAKDLQIIQLELVTNTTVAGTFYGIAFTLFCLYAHALAPRLVKGDRKKQARFILAYSTIIMLCGLYVLVSNTWVYQNAYIKHSNYPGGPYLYILSRYHNSTALPVGLACQVAIDTLTSAIQIWRVWVIWNTTQCAYWVTLLPILCLLTFTGLNLRTSILEVTLSPVELGQLDYRIDQAETNALQGFTTILCTLLISGYLIFMQRRQRKLIGTETTQTDETTDVNTEVGKTQVSVGYTNIVAMIVESYALESIWLLAAAVLWGHDVLPFFAESVTYIEIIAYLLVQYRVARGQAYESRREQRNISSLRWNHSNHATTQSRDLSEIQVSPYVPAIPEVSSAPRVSSMA